MKSEFKYGSPEYHLDEAKEAIEKAQKLVTIEKQNFGEIQTLEVWKSPLKTLDSYGTSGYYNRFDKTKRHDVEKAYKNAIEATEKALEEIEAIQKRNEPLIEINKKVRENISNIMGLAGIPKTYSKWETPPRKRKAEWVTHSSGWAQDLERLVHINDNSNLWKRSVEDSKRRYTEQRDQYLFNINKLEKEKAAEDKKVLKAAAALNFAEKHGLKAEDGIDIISLVEEKAEELWVKENYPEGTEMSGGCQECDTWNVGDYRCSCGNRRVQLTVEGNFYDGFYAYAEGY